jgi:hypothetical protein
MWTEYNFEGLLEGSDRYSAAARDHGLCGIARNDDGNNKESSPPPFLPNYPP